MELAISSLFPGPYDRAEAFVKAKGGGVVTDTQFMATVVEMVWLSDADITDEDLIHVAILHPTYKVVLDNTQISDQGLRHFRNLPLYELHIRDTKVTDAGADLLKRWIPRCTIYR